MTKTKQRFAHLLGDYRCTLKLVTIIVVVVVVVVADDDDDDGAVI